MSLQIISSEDVQPLRQPPNFGTQFQQRLDSLLGTAFPGWQLRRMEARAQVNTKLHQYSGANTGRDRNPPQPLRNPDSPLAQSDALQMQRRAQDQGRDNAFIGHLAKQYRIYALGDIQYIPDTGSKIVNQKYRDYWSEWMKTADVQGRFHLIDMMQLGLTGTIYNGRHGFIHHHNADGTFQLQAVMGYNIGNPRAIYTNPQLVSGTVIDQAGRIIAYDLYRLGINGTVHFVQRVPAVIFSCFNPVESADEYAAKTPLHAILNDAHDMRLVENAWMKKIQWAAYKTAVFNTPNGAPPDPNESLDSIPGGSVANGRVRHQLPGEELHGEDGFNVDMLKNENPTNNETEFLLTKLAQIAMALNLPLPFVWVMMGLPGTYTRLISEQAKRAFQHGPLGQKWMERVALNEIKKMALLSGIIRGVIPWVERWDRGYFMYPAHPTVDVGRESKANLDENRQGIRSMATITGEEALYWQDVDDQLAAEAENKIRLAIAKAAEITAATGVPMTWTEVMPFIQSLSANPVSPGEMQGQVESNSAQQASKKDAKRLENKIDALSTKLEEHDVSGEARDNDGKWTTSGGGNKKSRTPVKATPNRTSAPSCDDRCQRAKAAHVMVDKGIQRYAEEHNEPRVAKALGGVSFPDGEPIDIAIAGENGVVQHGIELKTIVKNSNGKITMKGDAIARKAKWERKNKAKIHTVVIDDTGVFNAKGEGKHDESKRKIYYANGYGSFRISTMHQAKDMEEVKALMNTAYKKLPAAAQKR